MSPPECPLPSVTGAFVTLRVLWVSSYWSETRSIDLQSLAETKKASLFRAAASVSDSRHTALLHLTSS